MKYPAGCSSMGAFYIAELWMMKSAVWYGRFCQNGRASIIFGLLCESGCAGTGECSRRDGGCIPSPNFSSMLIIRCFPTTTDRLLSPQLRHILNGDIAVFYLQTIKFSHYSIPPSSASPLIAAPISAMAPSCTLSSAVKETICSLNFSISSSVSSFSRR